MFGVEHGVFVDRVQCLEEVFEVVGVVFGELRDLFVQLW